MPFTRWRELEALETVTDFRAALWAEVQDYRAEARGGSASRAPSVRGSPVVAASLSRMGGTPRAPLPESSETNGADEPAPAPTEEVDQPAEAPIPAGPTHSPERTRDDGTIRASLASVPEDPAAPVDPVVSYARRSSLLRTGSYATFTSPPHRGHPPLPSTFYEGASPAASPQARIAPGAAQSGNTPQQPAQSGIPFPSQEGYVFPARARTMSHAGGDAARRLLRTLSTVSIHESGAGVPGGLEQIAPIGKYIREAPTAGDAPPSELPDELREGFGEDDEEEGSDAERQRAERQEKRRSRGGSKGPGKKGFHIHE